MHSQSRYLQTSSLPQIAKMMALEIRNKINLIFTYSLDVGKVVPSGYLEH